MTQSCCLIFHVVRLQRSLCGLWNCISCESVCLCVETIDFRLYSHENGDGKNYLTKIYEVLTSIKWQKVAYTFDMLFFSFPEWNIHIFNFVCRVFRLQVTVYGISRSRRKVKMKEKYRKKWRINVFAEKSTEYCRRDCCLCDFPPQPLLCYWRALLQTDLKLLYFEKKKELHSLSLVRFTTFSIYINILVTFWIH